MFETGLSVRKDIVLFEAIRPLHVNFYYDVTNFFGSSPICETVSQQENRPLPFRCEMCFLFI